MILLNLLLIIVLGFYAFSLIIKLIFNRRLKRLQRQMEDYTQDTNPSPNSETKNPHVNPAIGEYTEFEEVE